jgi:hypothetical protein
MAWSQPKIGNDIAPRHCYHMGRTTQISLPFTTNDAAHLILAWASNAGLPNIAGLADGRVIIIRGDARPVHAVVDAAAC